MRTVRDNNGDRYLVVKQADDSSLVRDPETGGERYIPNEELVVVNDEPPLSTAAAGIDPAVRRLLTATYDDQSLGLVVELVDRGSIPTVALLESYDLCESDLHGLLAEFRAAGLVEEADSSGQRGYAATDLAVRAIETLRGDESKAASRADADPNAEVTSTPSTTTE